MHVNILLDDLIGAENQNSHKNANFLQRPNLIKF